MIFVAKLWLVAVAVQAQAPTVFLNEDFESYSNTSALNATWPIVSTSPSRTNAVLAASDPGGVANKSVLTNYGVRRYGQTFTLVPTDDAPIVFSFRFYDHMTSVMENGEEKLVSGATYAEVRAAWDTLFAAGLYFSTNEGTHDVTRYQARVSEGPNWIQLATERSRGWQEFRFVIYGDTVDIYVNGTIDPNGRSIPWNGGGVMDRVEIGGRFSSTSFPANFDDIYLARDPSFAPEPRLEVLPRSEAGDFQMRLTGRGATRYAIEASTDLRQWQPIGPQLTSPGGVRTFSDPDSHDFDRRFYRAREEAGSNRHPFPGVEFVKIELSSPRNQVHVAFIDLEEHGIRVDATTPSTSLTTTDRWGEQNGALLAVNGDFFAWMDGTTFVYGDAVGGGQRWPLSRSARVGNTAHAGAWYYGNYGWIAFGDYGVEFSSTSHVKNNRHQYGAYSGWMPETVTGQIPAGTRALVSGFPQLVIEGQPIVCSDPTRNCFADRGDMHDRHPRTAMGLTEDMKTFILVVVDGRSTNSTGMYGSELAALMRSLGAWVAFNLDGGGSSTMWIRDQGIVNTPSGGSPRTVPNHWGVFPAEE